MDEFAVSRNGGGVEPASAYCSCVEDVLIIGYRNLLAGNGIEGAAQHA